MGETRGGRPPERRVYPGLVRPYTDDNDYVNQPKFVDNKMLRTKTDNRECSEHDPFSIYDDDSAHDHYFFLPAGKVDLNSFTRTSPQRESCGTWSRTKPPAINEKANLKNTNSEASSRCQCKTNQTQDIRHTRNCRKTRHECTRKSLITKDTRTSTSGDYCSLSADATAPHYPGIIRTRDTPIDEENFRKFALSLVRTSTNQPDINKNSNDYHDPTRTKDNNTKCPENVTETRTYEMYEMNKCIDQCTCMVCVKAGRYHWSGGDTDSFVEEPCNCIGGRKNIVRRWLCMGVLALFLPCLICYLPAKLCQSSCTSSECTKTQLTKDKQCFVKYVNERDVKLQEDGLL